MKQERFHLQFNWENTQRKVQIRSERVTGTTPVIAMYEVLWDDEYMFTLYPTFNDECCKTWKIVEQHLELQFPPGFIIVIGSLIEDVYIMN